MTTSRSRAVFNVHVFHNVAFGPDGKLSISVSFLVSTFKKLTRLSGVFAPFVGRFFKRAREREVELRHVVYEV